MWLWNKLKEKKTDSRNTKEHCQSFIRNKSTKSVKQSKIINYQPKASENPNNCWYKISYKDLSKTLHNLAKTVRQGEKFKVGYDSSLYSDTKKKKKNKTK